MRESEWVTLTRDVDGLLIPSAVPIAVPVGTPVEIIQTLGGNFTINVNGNLVRVEAKDGDALGKDEVPIDESEAPKLATGPADEKAIWEALSTCYDPEIPVNIVELGLIYEVIIDASEDPIKNDVTIKMTLTAPGCGMGPVIAEEVKSKVNGIENVTSATVELVFDPPWSQNMMSEAARLQLGLM